MRDKNLRTALILASVAAVLCAGFIARFWLFGH
ncbi:cytochrome oxidase small assembly protein [Chitinimonas koreensis]|nr:cytochrome oxidase small assembly protein [Chitinimonas koreensis]